MSQKARSQIGGKWSSGESLEEQVSSVEMLEEIFSFDNNYEYSESDKDGSRFNTAVVRGFWMEKSNSRSYKWEFVVNMELRKQSEEDEIVAIQFPFNEEAGNIINRKWELKEFLKIFGVDDESISEMIGRKCLYKDLRDKNEKDLDEGLRFFNSRRTQWYYDSQLVSMGLMLFSVASFIPLGAINEDLMLISLATLTVGLGIAGVGSFRRRLDTNGFSVVKNYRIRD